MLLSESAVFHPFPDQLYHITHRPTRTVVSMLKDSAGHGRAVMVTDALVMMSHHYPVNSPKDQRRGP